MKNWKKYIVSMLFALASVLFLVLAVVKPVVKGEPINYSSLVFVFVFFTIAVFFFAVGRKSGGGSGPPGA